jgi:hypothetical protein
MEAASGTPARPHNVIQVAFDWYDCHLHAYSTPYGEFGVPDPDLGHRSEAPVTLEQVAPAAGSKISYTHRRRTAAASGAMPNSWPA